MKHRLSLRTKDAITGFLFTLPALVGLAAFFVVPFGITLKMSLSESMGSSKFVGLKNYRDVLGSAAFKLAAKNTFKFFGVALPCILILSLLIALLLFRNLKKGGEERLDRLCRNIRIRALSRGADGGDPGEAENACRGTSELRKR